LISYPEKNKKIPKKANEIANGIKFYILKLNTNTFPSNLYKYGVYNTARETITPETISGNLDKK
jgi:hypothetical protein